MESAIALAAVLNATALDLLYSTSLCVFVSRRAALSVSNRSVQQRP